MEQANQIAKPNFYNAEKFKLEFRNSSNLKHDIQNRISDTIGTNFIEALNNMIGDTKNSVGVSFSEITRLALAYFFSEIFQNIKSDNFYTLEMVKGFFDACNLSNYTAIHEIDVEFFKLKEAKYYDHCWLIIQTAWFFNSEHFGQHQFIDYLNYYIETGQKLPLDQYNFDKQYLKKKYASIDSNNLIAIPINQDTLISQWYYCILFLICKELSLSTHNFNVVIKDNREFNPVTKTSRQLRVITPFKLNECDIKSAFPTFIDNIVGSNLKNYVYNNLMVTKNSSRDEAKILFNKNCNSGKYLSKMDALQFFKDCGYSNNQCEKILKLTHDKNVSFYSFMTAQEVIAINAFIVNNDLKRGTRLHDAILFIDTNCNPAQLRVNDNCDFGFKELNQPIFKNSFKLSKKKLPYAFINSIPKGLQLIEKHEYAKPQSKGESNGFRFYFAKYDYVTAVFNLNKYLRDENTFVLECIAMFSTLYQLNNNTLKHSHIDLILKLIREKSNLVFNVRTISAKFKNFDFLKYEIQIKSRDYSLTKPLKFKNRNEFVQALNCARGQVNINYNLYNLFCLINERIENNDYEYLDELKVIGTKQNNLLVRSIVQLFNLLCTGHVRKPRKSVKSKPLYSNLIKSLTLNSKPSISKTQNATICKIISKYEKDLKAFNRLINNRELAKQLYLILCDIIQENSNCNIIKDTNVQHQLKIQLLQLMNNNKIHNDITTVEDFDKKFISKNNMKIVPKTINKDTFETDYSGSIFNNITIEEAHYKGEVFFQEYLKFHGENEVNKPKIVPPLIKETYIFPELDFPE